MSDEQPKRPADADADLEREIRKERKFSLAEAIGRLAGPGMMKGVSPITGKQQSEAEIERYLEQHLRDAEGSLPFVLPRRIKGTDPPPHLEKVADAASPCRSTLLGSL